MKRRTRDSKESNHTKKVFSTNTQNQEGADLSDQPEKKQYDMLVFCHLRWDFVYQRPQQLMERLSKFYRILFIEEPLPALLEQEKPSALRKVNEQLDVLTPACSHLEEIDTVISDYVSYSNVPIGWFYSPAFVGVLQHLSFRTVVYDCMDELSLFKGANPQLTSQEKYLLSEADLVFTGGKKLYESKSKEHSEVFCFPSSVDQRHFERALNGIQIPGELKLPKPIIGYYGVIDERIDLELLYQVAHRLPAASFVMVGPLAKISEADLPRLKNIHYTGMKPYSMLPAYLKGFDIAMMPFALNDATKFISPTKTLEYMAGHKPIVSTPVYDVVRDYSHCIEIVGDAEEFCNAVQRIVNEGKSLKEMRISQYEAILRATSWNQTANKMYELIKGVTA